MKKMMNWVLTLEPMVHAMAFCGLCVLPARAQEPAKQWYDNYNLINAQLNIRF